MTEFNPLLPELSVWNNGDGIDAVGWLYTFATSDVAVAYSELFWPRFVVFEGYVLRDTFNLDTLRSWERAENSSRALVEIYTNLLDVGELFTLNNQDWSPIVNLRAVHIGKVLAQIYELKLRADFPDRKFEISFRDRSEDDGEVSISFWQL